MLETIKRVLFLDQNLLLSIFTNILSFMKNNHTTEAVDNMACISIKTNEIQLDVSLTVHHSIDLFHLPTLMHSPFIH